MVRSPVSPSIIILLIYRENTEGIHVVLSVTGSDTLRINCLRKKNSVSKTHTNKLGALSKSLAGTDHDSFMRRNGTSGT